MIRIFIPAARSATSAPTSPKPMIPRVLPLSSLPFSPFLSQSPLLMEASASVIRRDSESNNVTACSAMETATLS